MLDLAALALCHASQYYALICIYSYAGFMAADLHWVRDKDSAGFVSGLLGGALPFGRLFSAFLWGWAADRWGRRPVVLLSMATLCVGHLSFGFARPLWLSVMVRLMMGALNGWSTLTCLLAHEVINLPSTSVGTQCNNHIMYTGRWPQAGEQRAGLHIWCSQCNAARRPRCGSRTVRGSCIWP